MFLAVDIGNTQTSFGFFKNDKLIHHLRIQTLLGRTSDEYAVLWFPLIQTVGVNPEDISEVALASVVPPAEAALLGFCKQYLKKSPLIIDSRLDLGFQVNVGVPGEVGADRLANTAYAVKYLHLPAVVVDFGTATTFDVISENGVYEGGMILPGVRLSMEALSLKTSKLSNVGITFPDCVIGKNTVECIQSGVLNGYVDMINGLLTRVETELGPLRTVALTGGLSLLFAERLAKEIIVLPNLTLEGIFLIYQRNS